MRHAGCGLLRIVALLFALVFVASCTSAPTSVLVLVDTEAPTRVLTLRVSVSRGAMTSAHPEVRTWSRDGGTPVARFPASFGVVPGAGPNDGIAYLAVDATFSPGAAGQPAISVHRSARFRFTPHTPTVLRLYLPLSCGAEVAPPLQCRDTTAPCTLSAYCEQLVPPQTCGDQGRCQAIDTPTQPLLPDGGLPIADAATDVSDVTDATRIDGCTPTCGTRRCGSDGCGGTCGTCGTGQTCDATGACRCIPSCGGRACGGDGCGGSCGTCPTGQTCNASGACGCIPSCAGRVCGGDGCGGSCGSCGGLSCNRDGQCVASCSPDCTGRTCGDDGCGGSCGGCSAAQMCTTGGTCVCAPNCVGRACDSDGCGGSCGSCSTGSVCNASGQCIVCNPGGGCDTSNPCVSGTVVCTGAAPMCQAASPMPPGTQCPGGTCDGAGTCVTCGSTREVCDGVDNNCNAMIDEGAGCVRTIDVTTWTPDHACLSTYDDFRSGPDYLCQQMGYARSTGTFQCDPISCITDPAYVCTLVDARHNGGWFYDISGTTYGEGWCVGMSCVSSIQCVIP